MINMFNNRMGNFGSRPTMQLPAQGWNTGWGSGGFGARPQPAQPGNPGGTGGGAWTGGSPPGGFNENPTQLNYTGGNNVNPNGPIGDMMLRIGPDGRQILGPGQQASTPNFRHNPDGSIITGDEAYFGPNVGLAPGQSPSTPNGMPQSPQDMHALLQQLFGGMGNSQMGQAGMRGPRPAMQGGWSGGSGPGGVQDMGQYFGTGGVAQPWGGAPAGSVNDNWNRGMRAVNAGAGNIRNTLGNIMGYGGGAAPKPMQLPSAPPQQTLQNGNQVPFSFGY